MSGLAKIKVLIVDDSGLARALLRELLESDAEISVVGEAANGREAIEQTLALKPDVVTLDLEMPVMGGHETIEQIMAVCAVPILVVSSLDDAQNAYAAITRGALEVMGKPQLELLEIEQFTRKVKLLAKIKVIKHLRPARIVAADKARENIFAAPIQMTDGYKDIFAIASSTGGPQALKSILQQLPADFPKPIVIAQHISIGFENGMVDWLNNNVPLTVKVADDAELLMPGQVYVSPSERYMSIGANRRVLLCTPSEHDIYHPNCDLLLNSVAAVYGKQAVGIICTGMGNDGVAGIQSIKVAGGVTLAQDEASSVIFGMNQVAIKQNCISQVLSLEAIPSVMLSLSGYKKP